MDSLAYRVAARVAKDFPTEQALRQYLKDHPKADPSHHKVVDNAEQSKKRPEGPGEPKKQPELDKGEQKSQKPAEPGQQERSKPELKLKQPNKKPKVVIPLGMGKQVLPQPGEEPDAKPEPKKNLKDRLKDSLKSKFKGLSEKAKSFAGNLKDESKQFIADPEYRKETLKKTVKGIATSPVSYAKRLIKVAKHEAHEFKTAGQGIGEVLKGNKMSKEQKHAFKKVATHMAITATAASFAGPGLAAFGGAFGKAVGRQIAVKAVADALESIHILDELGHIGHGLAHVLQKLASEDKDESNEQKMAMLVLAAVTKHIHNLDDEMIQEALEDAAKEEGTKEAAMVLRVVARYQKKSHA